MVSLLWLSLSCLSLRLIAQEASWKCHVASGPYVLNMFFFDKVNPYFHLAVSVT